MKRLGALPVNRGLAALLICIAACSREPSPPPPPPPTFAEIRALAAETPMELAVAQQMLVKAETPFHLVYWLSDLEVVPIDVHCEAPATSGFVHAGLRAKDSIAFDHSGQTDYAGDFETAERRNLKTVESPDFPHPDVCRPLREGENHARPGRDPLIGAQPARIVNGPARGLHDAARRGKLKEIRHWTTQGPGVNTPDAWGLTALAWATLRDRPEAMSLLIDLGADPDAYVQGSRSARWYAARMGRDDLFTILARRPVRWWVGSVLLTAAAEGGSVEIVRSVLASDDDPWPVAGALSANIVQGDPTIRRLLLARGGDRAPEFLLNAALWGGDVDALEQALGLGAALVPERGKPPLHEAVSGEPPRADAAVAALLAEERRRERTGAGEMDGDHLATALGILVSAAWRDVDESVADEARRQEIILQHLLEAGARPPARIDDRPLVVLAVGGRYLSETDWRHGRASPSSRLLPEAWLVALTGAGMEINAPWLGKTALDWVTEAHGPASPEAKLLESLGARRITEWPPRRS